MDCGLVAIYKLHLTLVPYEAELPLIKIDFNLLIITVANHRFVHNAHVSRSSKSLFQQG